ncbi:hypothetical protein [Streptomyces mexicanus]|uniref:Uncharacterized protein n=1 Tax=Streptomyces mexicanus TaxID=178566 RepID=A0A7X1LP36_9ACTN|nr:hypothetical protein [Streptomyces mexicanus]MBC2864473.1 hypothetical protein [Streptomyces mexicanus]
MADAQDRLLAWLKAAPKTLSWTQDHMAWRDASGTQVLHGYVDVDIPQASAAAGLGWTWTVASDPDIDEGDRDLWFVIELPYTVTVYGVEDPARTALPAAAIVPAGEEPTAEQVQRFAQLATEHSGRTRVAGGWLPEDISKAVAGWIFRHTGLRKELHYDSSLTSRMAEILMRRLESEE